MFIDRISWLMLIISRIFVQCKSERDFFTGEPSTLESSDDFVDPYSFYYDKNVQKEVAPSHLSQRLGIDGATDSDGDDCITCEAELHLCKISLRNRPKLTDVADELFSRRIVNTLLSRAKLKQDGQAFAGYLELDANESDLEALKKFAEGKSTIREIDATLNRIIKTPTHGGIIESAMWLYDIVSGFFSITYSLLEYITDNRNVITLGLCTLYLVRVLKRMKYNFWTIISVGTMTIFVLSFLITWWKLIQEAEIKHSTLQMKHMKMPIHCQPEKMSLWDKFTTLFASTDDCLKYHEAMMKTPFLQVTPAQALSHMFSHVIYEPIILSGKALHSFLDHVTADMPFWLARPTQLLISTTFLPLVVLSIILLAGGSLSMGGFGFLSLLRLRGPEKTIKRPNKSLDSKRERNPIEIILNINAKSHSLEPRKIELHESRTPDKLALEDKSEENNGKTDKEAMPLKLSKLEDGSGDRNVNNASSESEDESFEMNMKTSQDNGSGDHASK